MQQHGVAGCGTTKVGREIAECKAVSRPRDSGGSGAEAATSAMAITTTMAISGAAFDGTVPDGRTGSEKTSCLMNITHSYW